jgi:hypothetical protein
MEVYPAVRMTVGATVDAIANIIKIEVSIKMLLGQ